MECAPPFFFLILSREHKDGMVIKSLMYPRIVLYSDIYANFHFVPFLSVHSAPIVTIISQQS